MQNLPHPRRPRPVQVGAEDNPNLFVAFALLNITGYHTENGWMFDASRQRVRERLAGDAERWSARVAESPFSASLHRAGGAMLMDRIPLYLTPFSFEISSGRPRYSTQWQTRSFDTLAGIEALLEEFTRVEALRALWDEQAGARADRLVQLREIEASLVAVAGQFEPPDSAEALQIHLWPNLLDSRGRGYSLSTAGESWLFLSSPGDRGQLEVLAVHELLHRWVDPKAESVAAIPAERDPMPLARARFRVVAEAYPDLVVLVAETVVRALTASILPHLIARQYGSVAQYVQQWQDNGFVALRAVYDHICRSPETSRVALIDESVAMAHAALCRLE